MKTVISLPDDLVARVDRCAHRLKLTRSGLFAAAAREFLHRHELEEAAATEAWNRAIAEGGQPADEPGAAAMRRHSLRVVRKQVGKRF